MTDTGIEGYTSMEDVVIKSVSGPTYFVVGADLLRVNLTTGEVTGSVETASEAGRVFVEAIRSMLSPDPLVVKARNLVELMNDAERNHGGLLRVETLRARGELALELGKWAK